MTSHQKIFISIVSLLCIASVFQAANPSAIAQECALEQARQRAAAAKAQAARDANWARIQAQRAAQQRPR